MGHGVFAVRFHFTECLAISLGNENRVVAKPPLTSGWESKGSENPPFEQFSFVFWRGERQDTDKPGPKIPFALFLQRAFNSRHCKPEVLSGAGPARGMNSWCSTKRGNTKSGIVSQCHVARFVGCRFGLDSGILRKTAARLFWFRQTKFNRTCGSYPKRIQQGVYLCNFPGIVTGNDKLVAGANANQSFRAFFCSATSSDVPFRASVKSSVNCASLNGAPSAVPCISTNPPLPVSTKLASVSAAESSG